MSKFMKSFILLLLTILVLAFVYAIYCGIAWCIIRLICWAFNLTYSFKYVLCLGVVLLIISNPQITLNVKEN